MIAQDAQNAQNDQDAFAKVNLTLRVHDRRADGYHNLTSLVAFADYGDHMKVQTNPEITAKINGPFASKLADMPEAELSFIKAAKLLQKHVQARHEARFEGVRLDGVRLEIEKNLPLAAGLGGGSSDAAAMLRALNALWALGFTDTELAEIGLELGSDVPVCVMSKPCFMRQRGEDITPLTAFPSCSIVLVNAGIVMPTGPVFAALGRQQHDPNSDHERTASVSCPPAFDALSDVVTYMKAQGNDLLEPACRIAPAIGEMIAQIEATQALIASMSGSGATCFGLYADPEAAHQAAAQLSDIYPKAFVVATTLRPVE